MGGFSIFMITKKTIAHYFIHGLALGSWALGLCVCALVAFTWYQNPNGRLKPYTLGQVVDLRIDSSYGYLVKGGWSGKEPRYRWTDGKEAILSFDLTESIDTNRRYALRLQIVDVIGQCQPLKLSVNKQFIAERTVCSGDSLVEFQLPRQYIQNNTSFVLHLGLPNAQMLPTDPRHLALGVLSFQLYAYQ